MDAARSRYWNSFGGSPGLTFLLGPFSEILRSRGWKPSHLETVFVTNPARAYALACDQAAQGVRTEGSRV
jgi:hypothetical protein